MIRSQSQKIFLARAMSLVVLLASLLVAGHVHTEQDRYSNHDHHGHYDLYSHLNALQDHHQDLESGAKSSGVENCFSYHQLQSHDLALVGFIAISPLRETIENNAAPAAYKKAGHVFPPARAPPIAS